MKKLGLLVMVAVFSNFGIGARAVRTVQAEQTSLALGMIAGSYAARSIGFETFCINTGGCSAKSPTLVPFNTAAVGRGVVDVNGNYCGTAQGVGVAVAGSAAQAAASLRVVAGKAAMDLLTEEADSTFNLYVGGACNGAKFLPKGSTLLATGTTHDVFSNVSNRVDVIVTSYKKLSGDAAGVLDAVVLTRQP